MADVQQLAKLPLGLSASQAAQTLGVSLGTIRRWSDLGYIKSYRTPTGQRRFSEDQLTEFIDTLHRRQPGISAERHAI